MNSAKTAIPHAVELKRNGAGEKSLWSVREGCSPLKKATSGNGGRNYNGTYADINGGYSYDNHMRRPLWRSGRRTVTSEIFCFRQQWTTPSHIG